MPSTLTPNMSLIVPTVGEEPSPTWAEDLNADMSLLDQHNHASGNGVQIDPSGLNINSDLPFLNNDATQLRSVRFTIQASPLTGASPDLGCLYVSGVDLYYNDENGNQVRITQSGGVAGSPGSIANLTSPASATYVSATPAFVFQSDANTPANLDGGSLVIRNILANSKGITINPPPALANNYSVTFPASLPGAQNFVTLDASGNIAAPIALSGGITGSNIASNVSLAGNQVKANSQNVVTSNTNAATGLSIIRGSVSDTGSITGGEGFTVSHPGTGVYGITYTTAMASKPIVTATVNDGSAQQVFINILNNANATDFTVQIVAVGGAGANVAFSFIAIGPKT